MQPPAPHTPRYVHVTDDWETVAAAWRRLGFEPVAAWKGGRRSTLFRCGPSFVELVDGAAALARDEPEPASALAVG